MGGIREGELFAKKYEVGERLDRGSVRSIYLSTDGGRVCLIKVLAEPLRGDAEITRRFLKSAESYRKAAHPNLAKLTDHGEAEGIPFCVSEPFYGTDLATLMRGRSHLPWDFVRSVALQTCDALLALHSCRIIHNDLKPAKILMKETLQGPEVMLLDSVLSACAGEPINAGLSGRPFFGSIDYVPPERIDGGSSSRSYDPDMDVYSLGATLFHLLSGKPPFRGASALESLLARADQDPPVPEYPEASGSALRSTVKGLVMTAMGRLPGERFRSVAELREAIFSA